ncbi:MAG: hypothetical protein DRH21_04465 [Deltaproteobacteria bacterium]|nr:MAG: hypothetical protein DRH21_04465 [Deltaproteobacteria bacterium]
MSAIDLRKKIKELVEVERNESILEAIKALLQEAGNKSVAKEKLISRARKSELDIENGRLMDRSEIEVKTNEFLKE